MRAFFVYNNPMNVMTFNVRYTNETDGRHAWSKRKDVLLRYLRFTQPDVCGTQELTDTALAFLASNLPEYTFVGDGREADRTGERCGVLVRNDVFDLLKTETVWLNGDFHKAGDADPEEGFPRICTMVLLKEKASGRKFRLFNAHIAYQSQRAILTNSIQLARYIRRFNSTKIPWILMGDFNSPITHAFHTPFLAMAQEAYMTLNQERPNTFHAYGDPQGLDAIDFIYIQGLTFNSVTTDTTQLDGLYPSDHYPVLAELL
jgi:endonuclease/exonuclease/phosphatase family metal-dependent hydrolase